MCVDERGSRFSTFLTGPAVMIPVRHAVGMIGDKEPPGQVFGTAASAWASWRTSSSSERGGACQKVSPARGRRPFSTSPPLDFATQQISSTGRRRTA